MNRSAPRRSAAPTLALGASALLLATAATLTGCGDSGPSRHEVQSAQKAAALCLSRAGGGEMAALLMEGAVAPPRKAVISGHPKPDYVAPVVGVSGNPPIALGYEMRYTVYFAVVPAESNPGRDMTLDEAIKPAIGGGYLEVPRAKAAIVERCLGGSAPG